MLPFGWDSVTLLYINSTEFMNEILRREPVQAEPRVMVSARSIRLFWAPEPFGAER